MKFFFKDTKNCLKLFSYFFQMHATVECFLKYFIVYWKFISLQILNYSHAWVFTKLLTTFAFFTTVTEAFCQCLKFHRIESCFYCKAITIHVQ